MEHSLEVISNKKLIFHSNGKWLHPLFELESFLAQHKFNPANLILKDKIVGRAAALFQVYLGVKSVHAGMMSELAKELFDYFQINYQYEKLVEQIECRTEDLLKNEYDPKKGYEMIKKLAG